MRQFKKRTIALVLASVVTVVGSFATENFKNSLTGLTFETMSSGVVNMVVQTKRAYEGNVTPIRKDANTFILMLPEMNSLAATPDLGKTSGNIVSVNIRTMPYSNSAKGYTRVTIKTATPQMRISATNQVMLPSVSYNVIEKTQTSVSDEETIQKKVVTDEERRALVAQKKREEVENRTRVQAETQVKKQIVKVENDLAVKIF